MTWHCASCATTLTWAEPINGNPGMRKCPRCDEWMDLVTGPPRLTLDSEKLKRLAAAGITWSEENQDWIPDPAVWGRRRA